MEVIGSSWKGEMVYIQIFNENSKKTCMPLVLTSTKSGVSWNSTVPEMIMMY